MAGIENEVAPHAGAWIEIVIADSFWQVFSVAPHAGAWIEITITERGGNP